MTDSLTIRDRVIEHILAASDEDLEPAQVTDATLLRDELDLSSMQAITLVMDLEDEFGIEVEDEALEALRTVGDVLALIETRRAGAA